MRAIIRETVLMDDGFIQVQIEYEPTLPAEGTISRWKSFSFPPGTTLVDGQAEIIFWGQKLKSNIALQVTLTGLIGTTIAIP